MGPGNLAWSSSKSKSSSIPIPHLLCRRKCVVNRRVTRSWSTPDIFFSTLFVGCLVFCLSLLTETTFSVISPTKMKDQVLLTRSQNFKAPQGQTSQVQGWFHPSTITRPPLYLSDRASSTMFTRLAVCVTVHVRMKPYCFIILVRLTALPYIEVVC